MKKADRGLNEERVKCLIQRCSSFHLWKDCSSDYVDTFLSSYKPGSRDDSDSRSVIGQLGSRFTTSAQIETSRQLLAIRISMKCYTDLQGPQRINSNYFGLSETSPLPAGRHVWLLAKLPDHQMD